MVEQYKAVFLTERSPRHQEAARRAAPDEVEVVMLRGASRQEVLAELADTHILVSERSGEVDAALIAAGRRLRLIQRLGSLAYDIDLNAARAAGVPVCIWPVVGSIMVAEHMLMQMLALVKRLPEVSAIARDAGEWGRASRRTDENTYAYNWSGRTNIGGLYGQTVGILGFGEIGAELARRLRPFEPENVLYHKRRRLPSAAERDLGITYAEPGTIVAESDCLCVLLPYTPATDMSLNAATFAAMKRGACLVHCGSGSVIDEAALAEAIRQRHLGGAALDTFEWEPLPPGNPLVALARDPAANVLLTPHTAAATLPGGRAAEWINVRRLLAGEPLLHRVA